MRRELSQQIFEKFSNVKCHENMYSGIRIVPWGKIDGQTGTKKLTVAFQNFANTSKLIRTKQLYLNLVSAIPKCFDIYRIHECVSL